MNTTTGLFETLVGVAADSAATLSTKFRNSLIGRIYMGYGHMSAGIGHTVNINIPVVNEANVIDIGAGDIQIVDTDHTTVSLVFAHKQTVSFIVRAFDQIRAPIDLKLLYLDPNLEALLRKVNRHIASLITTGNFSTYASITGGADVFTRSNIATAWNNLAGGGVPVDDAGNLFFITSNTPYSNMLNDSSLVQESIVGVNAAEAAQQARFLQTYGAEITYDQQIPQPTPGSTYAALMFHRYAIAMRPGVEASMRDSGIMETTVTPPGTNLPITIQVSNSHEKQGAIVTLKTCYALGVVRPEFGSYLVTT